VKLFCHIYPIRQHKTQKIHQITQKVGTKRVFGLPFVTQSRKTKALLVKNSKRKA
jgi:hypothetical protein